MPDPLTKIELIAEIADLLHRYVYEEAADAIADDFLMQIAEEAVQNAQRIKDASYHDEYPKQPEEAHS